MITSSNDGNINLIEQLLVRPEETSSLRVRHDAYINNGRVIIGYAEQILDEATSIKVNNEYVSTC